MALTIEEQLNVLGGIVFPNDSSYTLTQLVNQVSINEAQTFMQGAKTVDFTVNQAAATYLRKMVEFTSTILRHRQSNAQLNDLLIAIYADTGTYASVSDATTVQWTTFLENNILEAMEIASGILPSEKADYDALP